ncbi:MAG: MATE family efflux transporter [Saprospiraceae bacterium]|nr:MATE family efflux transporter [Saprospiraceae bacterium]
MTQSQKFGSESIGRLLRQQAIPASIGILIMSIYGIVDTIFVGRWVGSLGIAAITVVMPITFLIGAIGMSIGIGGASIISRAYGDNNQDRANLAFAHQVVMTLVFAILFSIVGGIFMDDLLKIFGGKGDILEPAHEYFKITLYSVPFLAWAMMSNNVIRAEGYPKVAMYTLIVPAVANLILDPIFIVGFNMGIAGAAWATALGYIASGLYAMYYFLFGKSHLKVAWKDLILKSKIIREISAIGAVTLARQGTISVLYIVLNNALFKYGDELSISTWGIINRVMMFANFPVVGITQGFVPIAGYNYGAQLWDRVKSVILNAIKYGTIISFGLFALIMVFATQFVSIFTLDQEMINQAPYALRIVFLATPLITIQLIGSAYFQAIGKAAPALFLALTKQGIFLIPLILVLPLFWGINGIWISFPIADIAAAAISFRYLKKATDQISESTQSIAPLRTESAPMSSKAEHQ